MKRGQLVLSIFFHTFLTVLSHQNYPIACKAINAIFEKSYGKFSQNVDIISFGMSENDDIVKNIIKAQNESMTIKFSKIELDLWTNVINSSAVVLFES